MSRQQPPQSMADAYGRYAALIHAQLDALERGDVDAIEPLARERDSLAWQIDSLDSAEQEIGETRRQLERCLQADLRLRRRLETLQAEVQNSTRRLDHDRAGLRIYARAGIAGGTVDVSL
jgi:molecular chaperone GrpE (heat shock protein)